MKNDYIYNAVVKRIVDGDTIDVVVDLGFTIFSEQRLRLYGIDTFELRDQDPLKRDLALKSKQYVIDKIQGQQITIRTHKSDKYGRYLTEVFYGDNCLNEELKTLEYVNVYFGGSR